MARNVNVFVYGTLRPPQAGTSPDDSRYYPQIAQYVKTTAPGRLSSAQIFDLGTYPAAVRGHGVVYGDVLDVRPKALEIMDRIEGHPSFYRREKVQIDTAEGPQNAWVYWAPRELTIGRPRIINGDWLRREYDSTGLVGQADNAPVDSTLVDLVRRFAAAECSWMTTVRPDGRGHSTPIWHVWYDGRVYVVSEPTAVKTANLKQNPSVVMCHPDPMNPVIIEGWGTFAPSRLNQLQPLFKTKYDWDIRTDQEYTTIIEITPLKLMAWGKYGDGRWPGQAVMQIRRV